MKKNIFIVALALILSLSLLSLAGCKDEEEPNGAGGTTTAADTTTAAPDVTTTAPTTSDDPVTPEVAPALVLDAESVENYSFVRMDEMSDNYKEALSVLTAGVEAATGYKPVPKSDFLYMGETPAELEIILGETNREESADIYAGLKYNDYVVALIGSKLVIAGGSDASQLQAVEYFLSCFKDGKASFAEGFRYEYKATYAYDDVTIDGVSLKDYNIVYAAADNIVAANIIKNGIGELCGIRMNVIKHNADVTDHEIVVGDTNRNRDAEACDYYCYRLLPSEKSVHINSYDVYALNAAAHYFVDTAKEANGVLTLSALDYEYVVPHHSEYLEDIDNIYMRWADYWQAPEGMLDYEGKLASYINPGDRLMTVAHRGDAEYYPENSIESIISFYKMGGDVVELDVGYTRDGVLVLMHDSTLGRTTNYTDFAGKTIDGITFPTSNQVIHWSYEELTYLNLKEGLGGATAKLTPFKIPTLAEALKVCKNRLLVLPDKAQAANGGLWRYADVDGVQEGNLDNFLYDAMVESGNYQSILLSYGYLTTTEAIKLQKWLYEQTGVMPYIMLRENSNPIAAYKLLKQGAMPRSYAIQVNGSFNSATFPSRYEDAYEYLKDKCLMLGWTIVDSNYEYAVDGKESWDEMYELGYRMIMTNKYMTLVKYAAEIYEGIEK